MSFEQRISLALAERREKGQFRQRRVMAQSDARLLQVDGQRYLNFSGNDYLGLSHDPRVISAWQQGAARYGVGAGGSGHVTGYGAPHRAFEQQLAEWLGYSHALLFISGFAANQAVIAAMMAKNDRIFADKLAHASLLEAAALSPATLRRFAHNQPASLRKLLESTTHRQPASRHEKATHRQPASLPEKALHQQPELLSESTAHSPSASLEERAALHLPQKNLQGSMAGEGETLVVTEGVFSMDGDSAPLADLHQLTRQHGGWLMVDDAHGIGVTGEQGRGSCWQQQVRPELLVVTFGKAFGLSGAALLCDEGTADYLLQFARHLIYSTAMPPAQACALQEALVCVQQGDDLRQRLQQNIQQFRQGAAGLSLTLQPSATAIQPLIVGDETRTLNLAEKLRDKGCWVTAIRPPTVPPGTARLRITLSAAHGPEDIQRLLEVLHAAGA